ncbi:hydroxyacid dehydrogenase [Streptomyces sp. NPDC003758]|uniref:Hydroxyacid dehydrogenase n=1 Tax=Streptomyces cynarae TaxID=2981134 RepID=A0ABY6EDF2_9ACTN|nr:hydroxyacid dehydrogenase [Streptomyces cynarae]UXY24197.1 hydroxyacid dehydrogenase [Streptomyces cynarae]
MTLQPRRRATSDIRCTLAMSPPGLADHLFPDAVRRRLEGAVKVSPQILTEFTSPSSRAELADTDVLLTGWGCPPLDADALACAPRLAAVVSAAGSALPPLHADPVLAKRLRFANAGAANAVPVAEYSVAMILLAGKRIFESARLYRERRDFIDREAAFPDAGNYRRTVGLIGASRIGRLVIERLRQSTDLRIVVADPYLSVEEAALLGVHVVGVPELMRSVDVVSVHAPLLPETRGMITAELLALLPDGATVINSARGALIDQDALLAELAAGRLNAILDVTHPEVLPADHPFYDLDNVFLTPHMAGSVGNELRRMGEHVVDEVIRFARGEDFANPEHPQSAGAPIPAAE